MSEPTVSVVIPAYEAEGFLARAVESTLCQTRVPDEVWVVDDGSRDRTAEIARGFGASIRLVSQANAGAAAARNRAITEARGRWVAFLDADDVWVPEHLERALETLAARPSLVWYTAAFERLSDVFPRVVLRPDESSLRDDTYFEDYFVMAANFNNSTPATVVRRDVLIGLGGFDAAMEVAEDVDLWFRIALDHPEIGYCSGVAYANHTRAGSLSRSGRYTPAIAAAFVERCDTRARQHSPAAYERTRGFLAKWTIEVVRSAALECDRATLARALALDVPLPARWRRLARSCRALPTPLWRAAVAAWAGVRKLRYGTTG